MKDYALALPVVFLTAILVVLRMAGVIDWSWWVVLAPLWGFALFVAVAAALMLFFAWIGGMFK